MVKAQRQLACKTQFLKRSRLFKQPTLVNQYLGAQAAACGIDLGTTNSAIAVVLPEDGGVVVVRSNDGTAAIASVVAASPTDCSLAVVPSRRAASASDCVFSFKRYIGRSFSSLSESDRLNVPFRVTERADDAGVMLQTANGCDVSPEAASSKVVQHLLQSAEQMFGLQLDRAVVGVPAYFDDPQRNATQAATRNAGLETVQLLREPVAAALAYGVDVEADQLVLVVDLGGGTFDVSVLEVGGGAVEVLSHSGDNRLGGTDFDRVIASLIARKAGGSCNVSDMLEVAQSAREALSVNEKVGVLSDEQRLLEKGDLESADREAVLQRAVSVSNDELERECAHLLSRMSGPIEEAALASGVELGVVEEVGGQQTWGEERNIDEVLLVGGATRMRAVRRFVTSLSGADASLGEEVEPEAAVAAGAALHAATLQGYDTGVESFEPLQAQMMRALAKARIERGDLTIHSDESESTETE